jgi:hypothetical protein
MQTPFTTQSLNNMLGRLGVTVPARAQHAAQRNVAARDGHGHAATVCAGRYRHHGFLDGQ